MLSTHALIVKLLRSLGGRKEVEQYLRHYASVGAPPPAVSSPRSIARSPSRSR